MSMGMGSSFDMGLQANSSSYEAYYPSEEEAVPDITEVPLIEMVKEGTSLECISHRSLTAEDVEALAAFSETLTRLEGIVIDPNVPPEVVNASFSKLTKLKVLELTCSLPISGLLFLSNLVELEDLKLCKLKKNTSEESDSPLFQTLSHLSKLHKLEISGIQGAKNEDFQYLVDLPLSDLTFTKSPGLNNGAFCYLEQMHGLKTLTTDQLSPAAKQDLKEKLKLESLGHLPGWVIFP